MAPSTTAKVTSKGQITIPKHVRESLRLQPGDKVRFEIGEDGCAQMRAMNRSIDDIVGMLKPYTTVRLTTEQIKDSARDAAAEDVMRSFDRR